MCHKILYSSLNANKAKEYLPYQDLESRQMLLGLLESPELFAEHIRRFANSLTTQMVFGFRTTDIFDPRLLQLYVEFERWVQLTSNAFLALVDFYPPLRRLPDCLLPLKRTAKELYESEHNLFLSHWQNVLHRISEGGAQVSAQRESDESLLLTCPFSLVSRRPCGKRKKRKVSRMIWLVTSAVYCWKQGPIPRRRSSPHLCKLCSSFRTSNERARQRSIEYVAAAYPSLLTETCFRILVPA